MYTFAVLYITVWNALGKLSMKIFCLEAHSLMSIMSVNTVTIFDTFSAFLKLDIEKETF